MKLKVKLKKGWFYRNDVWFSKAYLSLPISARDLLQCLVTEINKVQNKRTKKWEETRNGELSFTEVQYIQITGRSKGTYYNAIKELIGRGFIKITHRGGGGSGDRSTFEVLISEEFTKEKQRWRRYPTENWEKDIPKAKDNLVGKKTQWKKGQSGRKLDPTLSDCILINDSPPNGLNPKNE
jgi:DNA-binding PadR family transcriptional regulator